MCPTNGVPPLPRSRLVEPSGTTRRAHPITGRRQHHAARHSGMPRPPPAQRLQVPGRYRQGQPKHPQRDSQDRSRHRAEAHPRQQAPPTASDTTPTATAPSTPPSTLTLDLGATTPTGAGNSRPRPSRPARPGNHPRRHGRSSRCSHRAPTTRRGQFRASRWQRPAHVDEFGQYWTPLAGGVDAPPPLCGDTAVAVHHAFGVCRPHRSAPGRRRPSRMTFIRGRAVGSHSSRSSRPR